MKLISIMRTAFSTKNRVTKIPIPIGKACLLIPTILLPRGKWYDFETGEEREGGGTITVDAPLGRLPLIARAGAVIPVQQVVQYTGEAPISPLGLIAFPPGEGTEYASPYYEDDGKTFEYQVGACWRRTFRQSASGGTRTLRMSQVSGTYTPPPPRRVDVRFMGVSSTPRDVRVGTTTILRAHAIPGDAGATAWTYDRARHAVEVVFPDTRGALDVVLHQ